MRVEEEQVPRRRDPLLVGTIAVVAALAVALVIWLLIGIVTDTAPSRMTVELDNPTSLTVNLEAIDEDGNVTALGRLEPGATATRADVPVPGADWTFVANYADQEVWQSDTVTADDVVDGRLSVQIGDTPEIEELESEGFE